MGKRKQLPLDGVVAGLKFNRPRGSYVEPAALMSQGIHSDYMGPIPQTYAASPGPMVVPQAEYDGYDPAPIMPTTPMLFLPAEPASPPPTPIPDYDVLRMTDAIFEQAMNSPEPPETSPEPIPLDQNVMGQDLLIGSIDDTVAAPDAYMAIEAAIDQQMAPPPEPPQPEHCPMEQLMDPFDRMWPMM